MSVCVKLKTSSRSLGNSRDYSIYDFAHSVKKKGRAPKSNTLAVAESCENEDAMDEDIRSLHVSPIQNADVHAEEETVYCDYMIDIWYLISEHIRPEDVGRFALICRKTAEVVQSAKFWQYLYRKHYNRNVEMPRWLQPDCMLMLKGLRARVIRSLFYTYLPFVHRLAATPFTDPHRVAGRQLVFSWYVKSKTGWNYYFKLKNRLIPGSRADQSAKMQSQKATLDFLHDTYMNPEEGCQILIIMSDKLHLLPQYHEQLVVKALFQTLEQGFTKYKIRLQMANYCHRIVDEMVFAPVRQVRVLDWWNPDYYLEDPTIEKREADQEQSPDQMERDADNVYWED